MAISINHMEHALQSIVAKQQELIAQNPGLTLVVITVNIPRAVERTQITSDIGYEALRVLLEYLGRKPDVQDVLERTTGFEAYVMVPMDPRDVKAMCADIEGTHPLGSLFNLDVVTPEGNVLRRRDVGFRGRRCMICGEPALTCVRRGTHSTPEIVEKIKDMHSDYFHRESIVR